MDIRLYQVDAFTDRLFGGNPAAVCPLEHWLPDEVMQQIAAENNLAETAFYVRVPGGLHIRWFTPAVEVDLCGHATLAAAHVAFHRDSCPGDVVQFTSRSGPLVVRRDGNLLELDFPVDVPETVPAPAGLVESLGGSPVSVLKGRTDYLVVYASEDDVRALSPDFRRLATVAARGVIVTAPGREVDFVSRFFGPQVGIDEDPVTGSAHTTLTPFWADRLGKPELTAAQLSTRGGSLRCRLFDKRVLIAGQAAPYLDGVITL